MPFVWFAAYPADGMIGGYSKALMVTYFFFIPFFNSCLNYYHYWNMHFEIKDGQIANYLTKPISYLVYQAASELAYRGWQTVCVFLAMLVLYPFLQGVLQLPAPSLRLLWLIPLMLIAALSNILIANIIGLAALWTTRAEWVDHFWWMLLALAGGYLAPISFFPEFIQNLLSYTPFPLILNVPIEFFLGILPVSALPHWLALGALWIGGLLLLNIVIWRRGLRRVDLVGM